MLEPLPPIAPREMVDVYFHSVGFGFDSTSNDFKVVRLLNVQSRSASNLLHISQEAEVCLMDSYTVEGHNVLGWKLFLVRDAASIR